MSRLSLLPLVCYAALVAYAVYATSVVGHWAYYNHPDPKELPLRPLLSVVSYIVLAGVLSVIVLPVFYAIQRLTVESKIRARNIKLRVPALLYLMGATVWISDLTLTLTDHHSLISWLID